MTPSPIIDAIDEDAFEYMLTHAPRYLAAIEAELRTGRTPAEIRRIVSREVGPERQSLALRCEQAARHMARETT